MRSLNRRIVKEYFEQHVEQADGWVPPEAFAMSIVKLACILIIGIVVLGGITNAANITENSTFYGLALSVRDNITSSYALASLMVLVLGASAVMHFLGFM